MNRDASQSINADSVLELNQKRAHHVALGWSVVMITAILALAYQVFLWALIVVFTITYRGVTYLNAQVAKVARTRSESDVSKAQDAMTMLKVSTLVCVGVVSMLGIVEVTSDFLTQGGVVARSVSPPVDVTFVPTEGATPSPQVTYPDSMATTGMRPR